MNDGRHPGVAPPSGGGGHCMLITLMMVNDSQETPTDFISAIPTFTMTARTFERINPSVNIEEPNQGDV